MAYKVGQLEIPSTRSQKKFVKKSRIRKMRKAAKKDFDSYPMCNRYKGYN